MTTTKRRRRPEPTIIYADDWIVVVDKPAGMLSTPAPGRAPVVLDRLCELGLIDRVEQLRPVHRLDRDASGVLVFARTTQAMQRLTDQFMRHGVEKVYLALVRGHPKGDGEVNLPLHIDRARRLARVDPESGKPARTAYRVLRRMRGLSLVECRPQTGRLHQIRAHMAAIGHPLAVDPVYGGWGAVLSPFPPGGAADGKPARADDRSAPGRSAKGAGRLRAAGQRQRPLIDRLTLHASGIAFDHPESGLRVTFEAELPPDFRRTLRVLSDRGAPAKRRP